MRSPDDPTCSAPNAGGGHPGGSGFAALSGAGGDEPVRSLIVGAVALGILYAISHHNALLFHLLTELLAVSVAWAVFLLVWNARETMDHDALLTVGIAYLFIGFLDLIHAAAFQGMGILSETWGTDPSIQLWVAARLMEAVTLLSFSILVGRRVRPGRVLAIYGAVTALALLGVFAWDLFPDCHREPGGVTPFKIGAEGLIRGILIAAGIGIYRRRRDLDPTIFGLMLAAISLTLVAESALMRHELESRLLSLIGHGARVPSIFMIYLALVHSGLRRPFSALSDDLREMTAALRNAKIERTTILDHQPDQVIFLDPDHRVVWANGAACRAAGVDRQALRGRLCRRVWNHSEAERQNCPVTLAFRTGQVEAAEIPPNTTDGRHLHIRACPIRDEAGTITHVLKIIEDVTERERAKESFRRSEERFSKAFHGSGMMMSISTIKDGIYEEVNDAFLRVSGYTREMVIGRSSVDLGFIRPSDREELRRRLLKNGRVDRMPLSLISRTGGRIDCRYTGEVITIDGEAKLLSIAQDVTDLVEARTELERERSLLRAIFRSTPDIMAVKEAGGAYRAVNPAFCELLGRGESEIIGRTDADLFPDPGAAPLPPPAAAPAEGNGPSGDDVRMDGPDGARWLQVIQTAVAAPGSGAPGTLYAGRDITERRRMERIMEARLGLSELAAAGSVDDLLQRAADDAERLTESRVAFFHLMSSDERSISTPVWSSATLAAGADPAGFQRHFDLKTAGIWADCLRTREPAIENDYPNAAHRRGLPDDHVPITRVMTLPVLRNETIVAMVGVGNKPTRYTKRDLSVLSRFAGMAWDVIVRKTAETALRESEEMFRRISEQSLLSIAILTEDGFDYVNAAYVRLTGYTEAELLEMPLAETVRMVHPDHRDFVTDQAGKKIRGETEGVVHQYVYLGVRKDGENRWVEQYSRTIRWRGRIANLMTLVDVTERERAKASLEQQKRTLQTILDGIPDVIGLQRPDHSIIAYNKAGYALMDRPKETVIGRKCYELIGQDRPCEDCATSLALRSGKNETVEKYVERFNRWFQANVIPIRDEDEAVTMVVEQLHDITARKEREIELRRLAMAMEQTGEAILITDRKGVIRYANPAFLEVSGYRHDEVIGRTPRILKSGAHKPEFYRNLWKTITSGNRWQGRIINRSKDGRQFTEEATISPVTDESGEIVSFVAVKRDITAELTLADQLQQARKMEAIGTLAGGIAHDFNNILFPIMGFAEMLQDEAAPGTVQRSHVDGILKATQRARDLVRQILTFSRRATPTRGRVWIQLILKELVKLGRATLPSTITIIDRIDASCPPVEADPTQIHQVAMNLLTNAYQAMEPDGGRLEIILETVPAEDRSSVPDLPPGIYIRLIVSDTGHGFDPGTRGRIFEPYFTTKAQGKGTGMGLSVVHGIVTQNGGEVVADSTPGQGTTFTVYLPALDPKTAEAEPAAPEGDIEGGDEHILVVDDEEQIVLLQTEMLQRLGYQVTGLRDSVAALDLIRESPDRFDLLITDLTMPRLTGERLAQQAREIRPDLPVILSTGFSDRVADLKGGNGKAIDAIAMKPMVRKEIAELIRQVLGG